MRRLSGYVGALVVVCIWGSTFVSSKVLLDVGLRPADIFLIRFVIAYLCMLAISHRRLFSDNWRDELVLFLLGITGTFKHNPNRIGIMATAVLLLAIGLVLMFSIPMPAGFDLLHFLHGQ